MRVELVKAILRDARQLMGEPRARGWIINAETLDIERDDEWWHAVQDAGGIMLTDDHVAMLPEAKRAQEKAVARAERKEAAYRRRGIYR